MSRNLLHKYHVEDFVSWLKRRGYEVSKGTNYQLYRFRFKDNLYHYGIYKRDTMPEHVTVDHRAEKLVRRFIRERKENKHEVLRER